MAGGDRQTRRGKEERETAVAAAAVFAKRKIPQEAGAIWSRRRTIIHGEVMLVQI